MLKVINLSEHRKPAQILWVLLAVSGAIALICSFISFVGFGVREWVASAAFLVIASLVGQYQLRLPNSRGYVSFREVVLFSAVFWIGPGGAAVVAAAAAVANFELGRKNPFRWVVDISTITVTTLFSAIIFYLILLGEFGLTVAPLGSTPVSAPWFLGAFFAAGLFHFFFYSVIYTLFLMLDGNMGIKKMWETNALFGVAGGFFCYFSVIGIHLLVVYFGPMFGLLMVPLVITGHLAFKFHQRKLTQKTSEMIEANRVHLATVEALATAIDARDQVGRGHVSRTQIYAVGIGRLLELDKNELEALNSGALLHDIGKLAVPDHILNKPGRLTPAEMEKMKIHASVGASILEKVGFPNPVVPTVRHHHERWDGTGYPDGLSKEEIPITARILCVADAYDTIRGARPYRASVSRDEARQYLKAGAGTQFDPRITDIFLRNLKKFETAIDEEDLSYRVTNVSGANQIERARSEGSDPGYIEQIKNANREVFTLYELARVFGSSLNLQDTLELFVNKIAELVPLDTCVVYLLDGAETVAIAKHVYGKHKEALKNRKVQVGQGATGYTLKKRQPVYNINPGLDFSFYQMEFIQEFRAMASLPLIANEKILGAVSLYSTELETYEDEHMRLLETTSRIASDAIATSLRHAETESRALTDPMTGLPNARSLGMQFDKEIARAGRSGSTFQVVMLDLDGFKRVNDTYGHKAGDALLKGLSRVLQKQLREYDFLARYAGDEFVAIVPDADKKAIAELCYRMEKAVREFKLDVGNGRVARVGVSLGAASYPANGDTLDQIIISADKAMYAVKARRKKRIKEQRDKILAEKRRKEQQAMQPLPVEITEIEVENPNPTLKPSRQTPDSKDSIIVELDESHVIDGDSPS